MVIIVEMIDQVFRQHVNSKSYFKCSKFVIVVGKKEAFKLLIKTLFSNRMGICL